MTGDEDRNKKSYRSKLQSSLKARPALLSGSHLRCEGQYITEMDFPVKRKLILSNEFGFYFPLPCLCLEISLVYFKKLCTCMSVTKTLS